MNPVLHTGPRSRHGSTMLLALVLAVPTTQAQQALQSDDKLACTAVMYLASATRTAECNEALAKYFSIQASNAVKTVKARRNFLALCPADNSEPNMSSWLDALANGAGHCDAASLNTTEFVASDPAYDPAVRASNPNIEEGPRERPNTQNQMPDHCVALLSHPWATGLSVYTPHYVGKPNQGGHWVGS